MNFSKFSVRRPVTTVMLMFILIAFGGLSIMNINMDLMPNMDIPVAIVNTTYQGSGSEEIERLVTSPLESALGTVPGVKTITSSSSYGSSMVVLELEDGTDIDIAALDMRERIDMVKAALPEDCGEPQVMKIDINSMNSLTLGISAKNGDLVGLKQTVEDKIANRLERQDGVASVNISGGKEKEVEVLLKEDQLRGFGISESMVTGLLRSENSSIPTGSVQQGDKNLSLRVSGEFTSLEDIRNMPLTTPLGSVIYMRDIADVNEVYKETASVTYIDGIPCVTLSVQKQSTANTVKVSEEVLKEWELLITDFPQYEFSVLIDPADYIEQSIATVIDSATQGALLAIIILYIFLRNYRSTLIVAIAIPVSIIATFLLMYYTKMTLNIMSLGGLTLGIGMLVDNSIVVLESIYRKMEEGIDRKTAAIEGAREVAASVTSSTLTTVAVFLPITFAGGLAAQIFNQLSMTITFSLMSSLVISLTFVPMACSILLNANAVKGLHKHRNIFTMLLDKVGALIDLLDKGYSVILGFCLRHKILTWLVVIVFIVLTGITLGFVKMEFMPESDESMVMVDIAMPKGSVLAETEEKVAAVEERLAQFEEVTLAYSSAGGNDFGIGGSGSDAGSIIYLLTGKAERTRSANEVGIAMAEAVADIPGCEISVSSSGSSMGSYGGSGISFNIFGEDLAVLTASAKEIADIVEGIPGTREVTTSIEDASPRATIRVDRVKASAFGITPANVSAIVSTAVSGAVATTYKISGQEFDIRVRQDKGNFDYITDIQTILIPTASGANIPLYEVADIITEDIPVTISKENQEKYVSVTATLEDASVNPNDITAAIVTAMDNYPFADGYHWEFTGSQMQMDETFGSLGTALLVALLLVYMIMAAEFESFLYPFIVMFSIPIAMTGGLFGLFVTGLSFNITAFLGLIMLAGVVINNAIVLIDYTNLLIRERGMNTLDALLKAGPTRLRPILMTTLTTVLALIPMLVSQTDGSELMRSLAGVVIFGLSLSTLVTLLFVPTVYMAFTNLRSRIARRLKKQPVAQTQESVVAQ